MPIYASTIDEIEGDEPASVNAFDLNRRNQLPPRPPTEEENRPLATMTGMTKYRETKIIELQKRQIAIL